MSFHGIGGLTVFALFLVHKGLSWNWIKVVSKKFFSKSLPIRIRIGYIVDILLFISMTFTVVSGIMISKTLFNAESGGRMLWQSGHYFAAAIAIILIGIHIGLHWPFIKKIFSKIIRLPHIVARVLGIIFVIVILSYGAYSMITGSFTIWLKTPFTTVSISNENMQQRKEMSESIKQKEEIPEDYWTVENKEFANRGKLQDNSSFNFGRI